AWSTCAARVREHDIVMLKRWQDEMDTLLIFAGLSSAVFTAFVIESWPMLQADPTTVTTQILLRISQQLGSLTVNTAFVNSTVPPFSSMEGLELPTAPSSPSVRINILWFFSLTLSLVSALGSILIKQWVREY
ncbi:hypothetical protein PUNSTDRAFT_37888, partial [Punctularia strigosozonata HHB-11173 SS5]|uniref:uncharacterized protein n=1 Tax=Punctularia strigosozonata (strain HHB-11173) TaxID=741275 RepID=UPI0004417C75